jgi:chaperonin GroEL
VIGNIIAEAMEKVGKEGVITVEEAKSLETTLDVVEGMQFDRGYLSPYFVTDSERMEASPQGPVHPHLRAKISQHEGPAPDLEQIAKAGRPLLIIAEDIDGEALATWSSTSCAARCKLLRGQGPRLRRSPQGDAQDIAILTGGRRSPKTSASSSRT